jgi:DNA-binding transcriptional ArsR family regulator
VASLRKDDVFSIAVDPTRNRIIKRLEEAGKAAYSDLLDSVDTVRHLTSTGNFNYHLEFLLKNSIITKDGPVYKLTDKGLEIARFIKDVDQSWSKLEPKLRGENMSIFSCAERFEKETRTKMLQNSTSFHGMDMISDEKRVIGIIAQEDCRKEFFASYQPLEVEDFKLCVKKGCKNESNLLILAHPDLKYYISPTMLSQVYQFLEEEFGEARIFAAKEKPYPFLFRAASMGKDYQGCAFMVAPCVF